MPRDTGRLPPKERTFHYDERPDQTVTEHANQIVGRKPEPTRRKPSPEELTKSLGGKWDGKNGKARCPAHEDKHPSLSIGLGNNGTPVMRCHTGCSQDHIIAALQNKNLWPKRRRAPQTAPSAEEEAAQMAIENAGAAAAEAKKLPSTMGCSLALLADAKKLPPEHLRSLGWSEIVYFGRPTVRIPYYDNDGHEAAVRFRIAVSGRDKFRWRRGSKPFLYGSFSIAAARDGNAAIILVEGETDCATLWFAGFHAAGLPGAANWREERDAPVLDGIGAIYVVIEPDAGGDAVRRWLAQSSIRDRAYLVALGGVKDISALYIDDPAQFAVRLQDRLDKAVPWRSEEEREAKERRKAAWRQCHALARNTDILGAFANRIHRSVVGEDRNVKLAYLCVTSRLLRRLVSLAVKGLSAAGKSFLVQQVLLFFPPDAYYALSAMSERSLAYGSEPLDHRVLVLYEAAGVSSDFGNYLLRSLLSEGCITYETVERTPQGLRPKVIKRPGPTGLITTTTALRVHQENETRLLSITISDNPEQTTAIMTAQAKDEEYDDDMAEWHALQVWLAGGPREVVTPFAAALASLIPPVAVRLRRDFPTLLALVKAHALLHRCNRKHSAAGKVIATIGDYEAVRRLMDAPLAEMLDTSVPKSVREVVDAVEKMAADHANSEYGVSLRQLAERLELDKSAVSRRARDAIERGHLKNLETTKGRPARLVLDEPLPNKDAGILPAGEDVRKKWAAQ